MEEENKLGGYPGTSGVSGHGSYIGYGKFRTWEKNTPESLVKLIKFRNESLHKEWMNSLEYPTSSGSAEEHRIKCTEIESRVNRKLNEIKTRYKELDEALDALETYIKWTS